MDENAILDANHNKNQEVLVPDKNAAAAGDNAAQLEEKPLDPEIEAMFKAGCHYGYSRTKRHPKIEPYIFGTKNRIDVFDLEKTKVKLEEAEIFLKEAGKKGLSLLIVGTKPSIGHLTEKYAKEAQLPYFSNRWIGGFITNFSEVKKRLEYFLAIELKRNSAEFSKLAKKQQFDLNRELKTLEKNFGGVKDVKEIPKTLLIIDAKEESTAVREAKRRNMPVVSIMSTDNNPEDALYPVPANDNAPKSVDFLLNRLINSYSEGKKEMAPSAEK